MFFLSNNVSFMVSVLVYCNNSDPPSNKTNKAISSTPYDGKMKEEIRKRNAYSREFSSTSTHVQTDAEPIRECVWVTDLPPQQIRFLQ